MWVPALTSLWKQDAVEGALEKWLCKETPGMPPVVFHGMPGSGRSVTLSVPLGSDEGTALLPGICPSRIPRMDSGNFWFHFWISVHRNPSYLTCPHVLLPHPHVCAEMRLGGFAENSWNLVKAVLTESWLLKAHCSPWLSWPHAFDIGVLSRPVWALAFCRGRTPSAGWFSLFLLCIFDDMYCIYVTQLYLCMPH